MSTTKTAERKVYNDKNNDGLPNQVDYEPVDIDLKLVEVEFSPENEKGFDLKANKRSKASLEDNIGAFFKEMARYPLLQSDEEVTLAHDVKLMVAVDDARRQLTEELDRQPSAAELVSGR